MFEQFDEETMAKALKRPFPLEQEMPDVFGRLLARIAETEARHAPQPRERQSASGRG